MKKLPVVLAVVYGSFCVTGVAQKTPSRPETIVPGSDLAATDTTGSAVRVSGAGLCRVHYDHEGRVADVTMIRSTGSSALDEDAARSARHNWQGLPNSTVSVPVKYSTAPVKKSSGTIRYETPIPHYPIWAERTRLSGTSVLQVLFDAQGKASFATVAKSSGNRALDDFTVRYALSHWKSSGGEESVLTYPVTFLYRERKTLDSDRATVPGLDIHPINR